MFKPNHKVVRRAAAVKGLARITLWENDTGSVLEIHRFNGEIEDMKNPTASFWDVLSHYQHEGFELLLTQQDREAYSGALAAA